MNLQRLGRFFVRHCGATSSILLLGSASFQTTVPFTHSYLLHHNPLIRPLSTQRSTLVRRSPTPFGFSRHSMSAKAADNDEASAVTHVNSELLPEWMLPERTRILTSTTDLKSSGKCVFYWMQRDVRSVDNWALLHAAEVSKDKQVPLHVVYAFLPPPGSESDDDDDADDLPPKVIDLPMTQRHGSFLLGGLECVHNELQQVEVPLHVVMPSSREFVGESICQLVDKFQPQLVVCDMNPLRPYRQFQEEQCVPLLDSREIPLHQVDAHNVVPVWHASPKREVGARTLRPKIHKVVSKFFQDYPEFKGNQHLSTKQPSLPSFDKNRYVNYLQLDDSVAPIDWAQPGTKNAEAQFDKFVKNGLKKFDSLRNDPNHRDVCSNLSPWINHGHISFQTLAMKVKKLNKYANGTAAYIEEGLVRRELSDNYVYYAPDTYDTLEAAAGWAQETLEVHSSDNREYVYSLEELEQGETHDDLWNAAELQLVREGKMHGFLRMYWAKKILEWTESPLVALRTAQYLNDKYALDGNDPNGFVGVGWSIMGIHDMGWKERPVFGKIRYMNYAGCKRKFKVADFVDRYAGASENADKAAAKHGKAKAPAKKGQKRKTPSK